MFMSNPFSELSASISPITMQGYVILMVLLVIGGTILDMIHKKSAQYFFENAKKRRKAQNSQWVPAKKHRLPLKCWQKKY